MRDAILLATGAAGAQLRSRQDFASEARAGRYAFSRAGAAPSTSAQIPSPAGAGDARDGRVERDASCRMPLLRLVRAIRLSDGEADDT